MKIPSDRQRLLDDVLSDSENFRAALLDTTLHAVRRRRQARMRHRQLLGAAMVALVVSLVIVKPRLHPPAVNPADSTMTPPPRGLALVSSVPLRTTMLVETRADSVGFVDSKPRTVVLVETGHEGTVVHEINDDELFALLAGRTAAIVRFRGAPAELLVLTAEDRLGFPPQ